MTAKWRMSAPLAVLGTIHLTVLFGGFLSPNSELLQNRHLAWAPPSKLHFFDSAGRFHLRPIVYPLVRNPASDRGYSEDSSRPSTVRFLVRGDEYRLAGLFPTDLRFIGTEPPVRIFFLGTDGFGRDVFARTLAGGRVSLYAGLLAAGLSLTIGTLLGSLAGFLGGKTDDFLMRLSELFLALPWLYLLLAVRAFLPLEMSSTATFFLLVSAVGLLGWATPARLVRGKVLIAKKLLFVTAGQSFGATQSHLLCRHVLPQIWPVLATQASILIPTFVLAEVALSFLGLGIAEPQPSWGALLAPLQRYSVISSYHWMLAPLMGLVLTLFAFFTLRLKILAD